MMIKNTLNRGNVVKTRQVYLFCVNEMTGDLLIAGNAMKLSQYIPGGQVNSEGTDWWSDFAKKVETQGVMINQSKYKERSVVYLIEEHMTMELDHMVLLCYLKLKTEEEVKEVVPNDPSCNGGVWVDPVDVGCDLFNGDCRTYDYALKNILEHYVCHFVDKQPIKTQEYLKLEMDLVASQYRICVYLAFIKLWSSLGRITGTSHANLLMAQAKTYVSFAVDQKLKVVRN